MNKPNYTLESVEGRVAALEQDNWKMIEDDTPITMTACIVHEARWLVEKLKQKRAKSKAEPKEGDRLKEIDKWTEDLYPRSGRAIQGGTFMRLPAKLVPAMRWLLDQLEVPHSAEMDGAEQDEFDDIMASELA